MSYQKVTGCLSQGAHPGSYNGQDAYNDMLVITERSERSSQKNRCGYDSYNQTITGEVSQTLKSQKGGDDAPRAVVKELPATEGGDAMTSVVRRLTPLE